MKTRRVAPHWALTLLVFVAASTMSDVSFAQDDARLGALRTAEMARFEANVNADAKALALLLDDQLEYVHSNGDVDTKSTFIEALTTGKRDYLSTAAEIQGVRIVGDVAIIRGHALVKVGDKGGERLLDIGYTDVWVWKDKRWQMTAWRSALMPPVARPASAK